MDTLITKDIIAKMSPDQFMQAMSHPELRKQIDAVLADPRTRAEIKAAEEAAAAPPVDPEIAEAQRALEVAEAERLAAEAAAAQTPEVQAAVAAEAARVAELARLQAEKDALEKAIAEKPKEIVVEYQPEDENGNPIGRPTKIRGASWEDIAKKQQAIHVEAVRAMNRFRKQRDQVTHEKAQPLIPTLTDEEIIQAQADLQSGDAVKVERGKQKLQLDAVIKLQRDAAIAQRDALVQQSVFKFMQGHVSDYNPCQANAKLMTDYITSNNLEWTVNNLEVAFTELQDQLAEVTRPTPTPVQAAPNPPNPAPVTPTPAVQPVPVAATVVAPVVAPNVPAAPARPRADGGLIPGTLGGGKPVVVAAKLTKKDIAGWSREEMRKQMQNPSRRAEINAVLAAR